MFLEVKRRLGLAYGWVGRLNGVQLQGWATFVFDASLIDLCDAVAEVLQLPLQDVSVELVYRSRYFYGPAVDQGWIGSAPAYLAQEAKALGILKRKRRENGPTVTEQIRRARVAPPVGSALLASGP